MYIYYIDHHVRCFFFFFFFFFPAVQVTDLKIMMLAPTLLHIIEGFSTVSKIVWTGDYESNLKLRTAVQTWHCKLSSALISSTHQYQLEGPNYE